MASINERIWFAERNKVCACCKKVFQTHGEDWGYWYKNRIACTYSCMRRMQKEDGAEDRLSYIADNSPEKKRKMPKEAVEKIIEMRCNRFSVRTIAESIGCTQYAVRTVINGRKIKIGNAKVTKEQRETFKRLYANGMTYSQIAGMYSIGTTTVRRHVLSIAKT